MRRLIYNIGYFFREAKTLLFTNSLSNLFSLLSIALIFFILTLVLSVGVIGRDMIDLLENEAKVSVYFREDLDHDEQMIQLEKIQNIDGIIGAELVDEDEAYLKMEALLGQEAKVLSYFDENPFSAYVEIQMNMDEYDRVMDSFSNVYGIDYIRDNRDILEQIQQITRVANILGIIFIIASGVSTFVIVSHIIRQSIYQNKEQLNTMTLLGAPRLFKAIPFVIEGMLMTLVGGGLAMAVASVIITIIHPELVTAMPFIPLPARDVLIREIWTIILIMSILLGLLGSSPSLSSSE